MKCFARTVTSNELLGTEQPKGMISVSGTTPYFPGGNDTVNAPFASVEKRTASRPEWADKMLNEVAKGNCTSPTPTHTPGATSTGVP